MSFLLYEQLREKKRGLGTRREKSRSQKKFLLLADGGLRRSHLFKNISKGRSALKVKMMVEVRSSDVSIQEKKRETL